MALEEADGTSACRSFGSNGEAHDSGPDYGDVDVCHEEIIRGIGELGDLVNGLRVPTDSSGTSARAGSTNASGGG
jgi:hypothetical protein